MAKTSGRTRGSIPASNPQMKGVTNVEKQNDHPLNGYSTLEREMKAYVMSKGGFDSKETDVILQTIGYWAGSGYRKIRGWQLGRDDNMPEIILNDCKVKANILEDFIDKMPKWNGGTTYRGIWSSQKRQLFDSLEVGDQWDARSLNSWSSSFSIGMEFAHRGGKESVVLRCSKPQNGTSIRDLRGLVREQEVLTSGKCRYRVVGKSYDDKGTLIIDMEPISNGNVRKE